MWVECPECPLPPEYTGPVICRRLKIFRRVFAGNSSIDDRDVSFRTARSPARRIPSKIDDFGGREFFRKFLGRAFSIEFRVLSRSVRTGREKFVLKTYYNSTFVEKLISTAFDLPCIPTQPFPLPADRQNCSLTNRIPTSFRQMLPKRTPDRPPTYAPIGQFEAREPVLAYRSA